MTTETKTAHTRGPWKIDREFHLYEHNKYYKIVAGDGYADAEMEASGFTFCGIISEADAKLIEAAPLLLEALKRLYNRAKIYGAFADTDDYNGRALQEALAAIKKATE